jgi:uncharacterized membrane protein YhhN
MPITLSVLGLLVISLLVSEKIACNKSNSHYKQLTKVSAATKMLASSLMVYFFYANIPIFSIPRLETFSYLIQTALLFSLLGDALLIPKSKSMYFLTGIASFALAHIAFSLAFLELTLDITILAISTVISLFAASYIYSWLMPHLKGHYRLVVPGYLAIILVMVILGSSVGISNQNYWLASGSLLFAISDIFVARNRFVQTEFYNRLIGLPLYYAAQIMIAYGSIKALTLI